MRDIGLASSLALQLVTTALSGTLLAVACSSEGDRTPSGDGGAGGGETSDGGTNEGGAPSGVGGVASAGATSAAGGAEPTNAAGAGDGAGAAGAGDPAGGAGGAGAAGAAATAGGCRVELSMNTSNATSPDVPLSERCEALSFEGQINFEISTGEDAEQRILKVDFFQEPAMGLSVALEDGYDFQAGRGAAASYMDSAGVWNADSGTIKIARASGESYLVELTDVHFVVLDSPVPTTNSGEFVANGTIDATAMPGL